MPLAVYEAALSIAQRYRIAKARSQRLLKTFDEGQHPRDEQGQWTDSGGDGDAKVYSQDSMQASIADLKKDAPKFYGDRTFSDDEIDAINKYVKFLDPKFGPGSKAEGFEAINSNLRKSSSYRSKTTDGLDSAIEKAIVPHDMIVHRGVGNTLTKKIAEQWSEDRDNVRFKDGAYVSTSVNKGRAAKFSKNVMEIRIKKGSNGLPITWNSEGEVLLERGQSYKVISVKKTAGGYRRIVAELE
jgi:hypothetical protein